MMKEDIKKALIELEYHQTKMAESKFNFWKKKYDLSVKHITPKKLDLLINMTEKLKEIDFYFKGNLQIKAMIKSCENQIKYLHEKLNIVTDKKL